MGGHASFQVSIHAGFDWMGLDGIHYPSIRTWPGCICSGSECTLAQGLSRVVTANDVFSGFIAQHLSLPSCQDIHCEFIPEDIRRPSLPWQFGSRTSERRVRPSKGSGTFPRSVSDQLRWGEMRGACRLRQHCGCPAITCGQTLLLL